MGTSNHPAFGKSIVTIEGRPEEHEAAILRQGQVVRLIQAKKCPCLIAGRASLHCDLCDGRGYILTWQKRYEIIEENSLHYGAAEIYPFWTPIKEAIKVQRRLHDIQGGNVTYEIGSFSDDSITLIDNGKLPLRHEMIKATYKYYIPDEVTNENSTSDGTFIIRTTGTELDVTGNTSNPFHVHGDIIIVTRVRNVTQTVTYTVDSFKKNSITLDDSTPLTHPAPLVTDILQVDYEFVKPIKIGVGKVDVKNAILKWGEDIQTGDLDVVIPGGYFLKRGNIVSLLTTVLSESLPIERGAGSIDELPYFDVDEIIGVITDVNGVEYTSSNFSLANYNDLVWGATKPAKGVKYTVTINYHPSYIVYKENVSSLSAEDKRFPHNVLLRKFDKFTAKELSVL